MGRPSARLAHEIAGFWLLHDAIAASSEVKRRLGEVLLVLRAAGGEIAAVTSIYEHSLPNVGRCVALRAFIDPARRGLPLMIATLEAMVAAIRDRAEAPTGIVIVSDNRKLMGPGNRRWYERRGWKRLSNDRAAKDEWLLMVGPGTDRSPRR